jgi:hypothetical protein
MNGGSEQQNPVFAAFARENCEEMAGSEKNRAR